MRKLFYGCNALVDLDLSSFDTSNVTDMSYMFDNCCSLESLDLSSFNTSSVANMLNMFNRCASLISLDLNSFDTNNVTNMASMLANCASLISLDLSNFNTENVLSMKSMFGYSSRLKILNIENIFLTMNSSCDISGMFEGCYDSTTTISIRNNVNKFSNIFLHSATIAESKITLNYTPETSSLVDQMIATKSSNSNVVKGVQI